MWYFIAAVVGVGAWMLGSKLSAPGASPGEHRYTVSAGGNTRTFRRYVDAKDWYDSASSPAILYDRGNPIEEK